MRQRSRGVSYTGQATNKCKALPPGSLPLRLNQMMASGPEPGCAHVPAAFPLRLTDDMPLFTSRTHLLHRAWAGAEDVPFVAERNEHLGATIAGQELSTLSR